jgi:hypothetical protein
MMVMVTLGATMECTWLKMNGRGSYAYDYYFLIGYELIDRRIEVKNFPGRLRCWKAKLWLQARFGG